MHHNAWNAVTHCTHAAQALRFLGRGPQHTLYTENMPSEEARCISSMSATLGAGDPGGIPLRLSSNRPLVHGKHMGDCGFCTLTASASFGSPQLNTVWGKAAVSFALLKTVMGKATVCFALIKIVARIHNTWRATLRLWCPRRHTCTTS